jgi:putative transposase
LDHSDTVTRTYRYRLYPKRRQAAELERQLGVACDLYNAALEQRRRMWRDHGRSIGFNEQSRQLTEARAELDELGRMNALAQHEVLRRVDRAFEAFFRRFRRGETPGYPRFRSRGRFDSLTWAQHGNGCHVSEEGSSNGRLYLQGVGHVKFRLHRALPEQRGQVTVRRKAGRWWVTIVCRRAKPAPAPPTGRQVGVDLGVHTLAALSTGELLEGPRAERAARRDLRRAARRVSRRQRGSQGRRRAGQSLARARERVAAIRRDHAYVLAGQLVERFDLIAIEDLRIANMTRSARGTVEEPGTNVRGKSGLNREILDQGWGIFATALHVKAEEAAREVVVVDPRRTSQTCGVCGASAPTPSWRRRFECPECGHAEDRDRNAARNVLARALAGREGSANAPGAGNRSRRAAGPSKAQHNATARGRAGGRDSVGGPAEPEPHHKARHRSRAGSATPSPSRAPA